MIIVIQNGHLDTHISKYLDEDVEVIKSFEKDVNDINLSNYSMVIILGGNVSVLEINKYLYLQQLIKFIKKCIETNIPLLGICLGCQLIAHVLGCSIMNSGKLNIGYDTKVLSFHNIFRSHHDYVIPNDKITIVDTFENMPYLFQTKNIVGIQCHPDIPPEEVIKHDEYKKLHTYIYNNFEIIDQNNNNFIKYLLDLLRKN